jgi:hypothetical protein
MSVSENEVAGAEAAPAYSALMPLASAILV